MRRKSPVAVQHWVDSLPTPIAHPTSTEPIPEAIPDITNENPIPDITSEDTIPDITNEDPETADKPDASEPDTSHNTDITQTEFKTVKAKGSTENVSDSEVLRYSTPVRIPKRGKIVRESSLPSDSPQRRRLLLRDSSFQSDDAVSHCSSVDSLLESRRADPEAVLLGLGFGPTQSQTDLSRIPQRFLGPSKVRGVDTEKFLKKQQLQREMHESGVWGYRGLTGDPHSPPSHIVAKIMERIHSKESCAQVSET